MPRLPFVMIRQAPHHSWCWAAVTASVWQYYHRPAMIRMCEVVTRVRGEPCCDPTPPGCEKEAPLDRALVAFNLLRPQPMGIVPFHAGPGQISITGEIDRGRPIGIGVSFGLYAHFCVVHGYERSAELVSVADSFFDDAPALPYAQLVSNYHERGEWKVTYLTAG